MSEETAEEAAAPEAAEAPPGATAEEEPEKAKEAAPPRSKLLLLGRGIDLVSLGLIMGAVVLLHTSFWTDDAYITFEYAQNLVHGHGLVFNTGEYVLGTTTPAYAALLALFGLALPSIPVAAMVVGWVSFAVLGVGLYLVFDQMRRGLGFCGLFALALVTVHPNLKYAFGMETILTVAVGFLIVWMYLSGRFPFTLGFLLVLGLLLRPDMCFLVGVVGLSALVWGKIPWRAGVSFALFGGAWILFAWYLYGNPLPNSFLVRWALRDFPIKTSAFLDQLFITQYRDFWRYHCLMWIALGGLIAGLLRGDRAVALVASWMMLYLVSFGVSSLEAHPWYFVTLYCGLYFGIALVPAVLLLRVNRGWVDLIARLAVLGVAWSTLSFAMKCNPPRPGGRHWAELANAHCQAYLDIADYLNTHSTPDQTVVTSEDGVLGFATRNRIIDTVGLVTPAAIKHLRDGHFGWWAELTPHPDFLVIHRGYSFEGVNWDFVGRNYDFVMDVRGNRLYRLKSIHVRDPRLPPPGTPGVVVWESINDEPVVAFSGRPPQPENIYILHENLVLHGTQALGYFDQGSDEGWTFVGDAMQGQPARGARPRQRSLGHFGGNGLINTFAANGGDTPQGWALSPSFVAGPKSFLVFMVGGGSTPATEVTLVCNDQVLLSAPGLNSEILRWVIWDLRPYEGKTLWIYVKDSSSGGWGHVLADNFFLAESMD
jgi:hypothetical protein